MVPSFFVTTYTWMTWLHMKCLWKSQCPQYSSQVNRTRRIWEADNVEISESCNDENLKGQLMSSACLYIYINNQHAKAIYDSPSQSFLTSGLR